MIEPPAATPAHGPNPLERRRADLDALARRDLGRRHRRRRDRRRRRPARCRLARDAGGAHRAGRHRRRDVVALVAADPRRPALSRAVPVRARARGARRAVAASWRSRRTSSGSSRCSSRSTASRSCSKVFYDAGLTLYDILGARHDGGWHRRLSKAATLELAPTLRTEGLRGGLLYHDGVEDDARYTLAVARTALAAGAVAVTRVRATGFAPTAPSGSIDGGRRRGPDDRRGPRASRPGRSSTRRASGPPSPTTRSAARRCDILPSRGAHLVVPRERIPNKTGLTIRVPGKVVFLVPWPDHWLIGTTDAPYEGPPDHPSAAGWEVDRLLDTVNATMDVDLTRDDVVGTYAGLRPLIAPSDGSTVKASREHRVTVESNGVVRIGGGKYTTYRVMARDVIDAVLGPAEAKERRSDTADWRLDRARPTPTPWRGSPGSCRRSRRSATSGRRPRHGWSPAMGRRRRRWSRSARSSTCCGRSSRVGLPRGRGRLGRPPRAGALARRRPGAPDPAGPGAARPRRGDRPARGRDPRRRARLGRCPPATRGRDVPRDGAARVLGAAAGSRPGAAARSSVDHDGLTAAARRHRLVTSRAHHPAMESLATCNARSSTAAIRTASRSRSRRSSSRSWSSSSRGGWAGSRRRGGIRAGRASRRDRPGRRAAVDLVPRLADLDPDRAGRAGDRRGARSASRRRSSRVAVDARPSWRRRTASVDAAADPVRGPHHRGAASSTAPTTSISGAGPRGSSRPRRDPTPSASTDFSVRNGPDLYVYLSPDADDYDDGALELGKLKATDGAFGYDLPPGTDPADFASAIIWCKQFSHLFAVAPLETI